jgi:hypothetical protein
LLSRFQSAGDVENRATGVQDALFVDRIDGARKGKTASEGFDSKVGRNIRDVGMAAIARAVPRDVAAGNGCAADG